MPLHGAQEGGFFHGYCCTKHFGPQDTVDAVKPIVERLLAEAGTR